VRRRRRPVPVRPHPRPVARLAGTGQRRLAAYLVKAGREQKLWTSWVEPDHAAEEAAAGAVPGILADPAVRERFSAWVDLVAESVATNTLSAKLVQLTALGVADLYQGQETVRLSVTDPDNRRQVDFDDLAGHLAAALDGQADSLERRKLLLTTRALKLRQRHPAAFVGPAAGYHRLDSTTPYGWGFARGGEQPDAVSVLTRLPRARQDAGGWREADGITLPEGTWHNLLTGADHTGEFRFAEHLGGWVCALLERKA
jgi:(1->4)-alpha-D-glucan 1-alpha-D-glucosylmutase